MNAQVFECDSCFGHGVIFIGDDEDYFIEPCLCQPDPL